MYTKGRIFQYLKLYVFGILFLNMIIAPCLAQTVIGSAGGDLSSSDYQLSFTFGETITKTLEIDGLMLTNGFWQTELFFVSELPQAGYFTMSPFPNPTKDYINIFTTTPGQQIREDLHYQLVDTRGRVLKSGILLLEKNQIGLLALPANLYLLRIYNNKELVNTYKIIKIL